MSWFLFDVKYYEPGQTVRTPKAEVDLGVDDTSVFTTGGVPYVIPPELIKIVGVDKVGPNTVIRTYLGSRVDRAVHPITTKIVPYTGDPHSFFYHCRGIGEAVGDHLFCEKIPEIGLQYAAAMCNHNCPDAGDFILENLYEHNLAPDCDTVDGDIEDTAKYFREEISPYTSITDMMPHSYRYSELSSLIEPILDLWVPDPYAPHRYDVRTLVSFLEPTVALKDHKYLGSSSSIQRFYPYLNVRYKKDRVAILTPNQELTDFGSYLQSNVLDEVYLKYISSKGEHVWRLEYAKAVFTPELNLNRRYIDNLVATITTSFSPDEMLYGLLPLDVKINSVEFCKTVDDVLYIKVNKSFEFVLDLTILSLGTQNLLWSEN